MHLILLHEDVAIDPRSHAPLLVKHLGLTPLEAKMALRRGRGILVDGVPEAAARAIAEELERAGIRCSAIEKPGMPAPRKAARLERAGDRLAWRIAGTEEGGAFAWDAIGVVSCGVVAKSGKPEKLALEGLPALHRLDRPEDREILRENMILRLDRRENRPRGPRGQSLFERIEAGREMKAYLDLVTADLWLRVGMDEFGYVLTAGAVQMGSAWGMDALVKDLSLKRAEAFTELTLDLLACEDPAPLAFAQLEDLNRYTTWVALRRRLNLEPEIPWAEPTSDAPRSP